MAKPISPVWDAGGEGTAGCIGYWLLDEGSGTTANDLSGNANHGTLAGSGGPDWTTGDFGPAVEDFANGYIGLDAHVADLGTTAPICLNILATTSSKTGSAVLWAAYSDDGSQQLALYLDTSGHPAIYAQNGGTADLSWATDCADGNPHAYAMVLRASNDLELWVDGVERASSAVTFSAFTALAKWTMGRQRFGGTSAMPWLGAIDCGSASVVSVPDIAALHAEWLAGTFSAAEGAPANVPPDTPSITPGTPAETGVTLTGSAFADDDVGDTHAASQWQVTASADTGYASPVISTGDDATNKTSYATTGLTAATAYRARVRYKDSAGNYSSWSTDATFTTASAITTFPLHRAAYGAEAQLTAGYTAGDPTLTVPDGSAFGTEFPMWVGCFRESGGAFTRLSVLEITGRTGDALDVGGAAGGTTDVDLEVGDWVVNVIDPLYLHELQAEVGTLQDDVTAVEADVATLEARPSGFWPMTWGWSGEGVSTGANPFPIKAEAARVARRIYLAANAGTFTADIETSADRSAWSTLATLALASGADIEDDLADLAIPAGHYVRANITAASGLNYPQVVLDTRRA